ncbi:MAG TPA: nucleoside hydrolase, partial [Ktedonobacteraceae bacterium]|nr:nucleoside hydrolase [Ktedonobacteraceae bacterium]
MRQLPGYSASGISQSRPKQIVLIDTDIGDDIDDALALALALHSPELDVRAVTTVFGNTNQRARLAAHLLAVFGREDIP